MAYRSLKFARVVFDADSTLSRIEGIDELARLRGVDVSGLTERAMRGEIPLESVFGARLMRVRPDAAMLAKVGALYVRGAVRGARSLLSDLSHAGVEPWIVSGGLRPALLPLARAMGIPGHRLIAVDVELDGRGKFVGFDESSPLTRADGKLEILRGLRPRGGKLAFVGDGATDLAAKPAVDLFIAFTGVAARPAVIAGAHRVASTYSELRPLLLGSNRSVHKTQ
ncbi:MAG: HAD-IB family phosphatase [Planctomycetes bacterium]|nr:HAD-IB family phosphatase [Planctomycetota bacterium]